MGQTVYNFEREDKAINNKTDEPRYE